MLNYFYESITFSHYFNRSDRAPTTILYDMIAAVRSAINFYNVSRYPETLHDKLMQVSNFFFLSVLCKYVKYSVLSKMFKIDLLNLS